MRRCIVLGTLLLCLGFVLMAGCGKPGDPAAVDPNAGGQPTPPEKPDVPGKPETPEEPEEPAAPPGPFPSAEVLSTDTPPTIDGDLDDPAWKDKRLKGAMLNVYTSKVATVQSRIYVTYDAKYLYVAFDMPEPNVGGMVTRQTDPGAHRDGPVWEDDSVEIFVDPLNGQKGPKYYHVVVNSRSVIHDEKVKDSRWDAPVVTAARVGTDRWTVEVAIPLANMGIKGSIKGQTWLANFCRNRQVTGTTEDTSWSDVGEEFHSWERYGHITFK